MALALALTYLFARGWTANPGTVLFWIGVGAAYAVPALVLVLLLAVTAWGDRRDRKVVQTAGENAVKSSRRRPVPFLRLHEDDDDAA